MSPAVEKSDASDALSVTVGSVEVESTPKPDMAAVDGLNVKEDENILSAQVGGDSEDGQEKSGLKIEKLSQQTPAVKHLQEEQKQKDEAEEINPKESQSRLQEGQKLAQEISEDQSKQSLEKSPNEKKKECQDEKKEEDDDATPRQELPRQQQSPQQRQQRSREHDREPGTHQHASPPVPSRGRQPRRSPAQPTQQPQSHYVSNSSTTDIVHSMFGPSVGLCMGDFTCQYNRITGRLYACTEAILFYSNLFGFEKKFYFRYEDVLQMQLYRETSIQVSVQEVQATSHYDYTFKGFSDRIQTLRLLISLWQHDQGAENIEAADEEEVNDINASNNNNNNNNDSVTSNNTPPDLSLIGLGDARPISPPTTTGDNDKKTLSLDAPSQSSLPNLPPSILRQSKISTPQQSNPPSPVRTNPGNNSTPRRLFAIEKSGKRSKSLPAVHRRRNRQRAHSDGTNQSLYSSTNVAAEDSMDLNQAPSDGNKEAWETAKNSADPSIQYVGIEPLKLSCSLGSFFDLFLANDAPHSFDVYQKGDAVRDLDIDISPWREDPSEKGALLRSLEFRHPVSKSLGIGPSHALTKKQQKLQRIPGYGLCLTNTTSVEGVPASDCFDVMDHWLVEAVKGEEPPQVVLSAKFGANFKKRTFLKSIILKNVKSGTQEWFQGYATMVQTAMMGQPSDTLLEKAPPPTALDAGANASRKVDEIVPGISRLFLMLVVVAQILLIVCLLWVVRELKASQNFLMEELKHMRMEQGQMLDLLLAQQNERHRD